MLHGVRDMWLAPHLRFAWVLPAIVFAVDAGCSRKTNVVPVSGRVTLDGQPMPNVALNFGPITGGLDAAYASDGKTDANGRYSLKLVDGGQPGAMIGKN